MAALTRVIFTADDFGLSPEVNAAVLQAHQQGLLRSASLLATGPAFAEATQIARDCDGLSVGLHMALVHEQAACRAEDVPTLADSEGRLPAHFGDFLRKWLPGRISRADVACEIDRQVQRLVKAGIRPTHLDSHQHLHLLPGVFESCLQACRRYGIAFMRIPGRGSLISSRPVRWSRRLQFYLLQCVAGRRRAQLRQESLRCCDGVWGLLEAGHMSSDGLVALLPRLGPGLHEVMTHPATEAQEERLRYRWGYDWRGELAALQSPAVGEALRDLGIGVSDFAAEAARLAR